jgi:hypothetical protein
MPKQDDGERSTESYYDPTPPTDAPNRHAYTLEVAQLTESRDQWQREAEDARKERDVLLSALEAARQEIAKNRSIPATWANAVNSAKGLCESQANRWEHHDPKTAQHWRTVAIHLGALYLAQDHARAESAEAQGDALRQQIADLQAQTRANADWEPMDTAPRDGTRILANVLTGLSPRIVKHALQGWVDDAGYWPSEPDMAGWMPLTAQRGTDRVTVDALTAALRELEANWRQAVGTNRLLTVSHPYLDAMERCASDLAVLLDRTGAGDGETTT